MSSRDVVEKPEDPGKSDSPFSDSSPFDGFGKPRATGTIFGRWALLSDRIHASSFPCDLVEVYESRDSSVELSRASQFSGLGTWPIRRSLARTLNVCHDESLPMDLRVTFIAEAIDMIAILRRRAMQFLEYEPTQEPFVEESSDIVQDEKAVHQHAIEESGNDSDEDENDAFARALS